MAFKHLCAIFFILLNKDSAQSADCDVPDDVPNANLLTDIAGFAHFTENYSLQYDCDAGFRGVFGRQRVCMDGEWTPIRCIRRTCKWLEDPDHGKRLDGNNFVGTRTNFKCDTGYQLVGSKGLLCRDNGLWRPSKPPTCKPVNCGPIPRLRHGEGFQNRLDEHVNTYGKVVVFSCDEGYDLRKGSGERRCQADGTWSGTQPVCEPPSCPDFDPPIYNGMAYHDDYELHEIGHVAQIECNEDSDRFPEDFDGFVSCLDQDKWSVNNIACERHLTVQPLNNMYMYKVTKSNQIEGVLTYSPVQLKSRTRLHVRCSTKYELYDGQAQRYMDKWGHDLTVFNGTYVPGLPICKKERCELDETFCSYTDTDGNPLAGKVEHDITVVKTCDTNYELEPVHLRTDSSYSSTCNQGSLVFPKCILKRCQIPAGRRVNRKGTGDLVQSGKTARLVCQDTEELYYLESGTYADAKRFETTCELGKWTSPIFPICKKIACVLPAVVNSLHNAESTYLQHDAEITLECENNYDLLEQGAAVPIGSVTVGCNLGNVTHDMDNYSCEPKGCTADPNANVYRTDNTGKVENDTATFFDHKQLASMQCKEHFIMYKDREVVGAKMSTRCSLGNWNPLYSCEKESCIIDLPAHSLLEADGLIQTGTATIESGLEGRFSCEQKYMLYNTWETVYMYSHYPIACVGQRINASLPTCVEKDAEECTAPSNARIVKGYFYTVICDDGYVLNTIENDRIYKCTDGKLLSYNYKREPICAENACRLTTDILSKMNVFSKETGNQNFYSDAREFDANDRLFFDCKEKNQEPVKRLFRCSKGNWKAAERDPNWTMEIDHLEASCRKANCSKGCHFGGTCWKDGKCKCAPGYSGANCETTQTRYTMELTVGSGAWGGCFDPLYVTLINQQGETISTIAYAKPTFTALYRERTYTSIGSTVGYLGKVDTIRIALGAPVRFKTDNIEINRIRLTVERGHTSEEYIFSSVGWVNEIDKPLTVRPDAGCLHPATNIQLKERKQSYMVGETLKASETLCLYTSIESVTCLKTGQWSTDMACLEHAEFSVVFKMGSHYAAGTGDSILISFHGDLGHSASLTLSRGRINKRMQYRKTLNDGYVGEINILELSKNDWAGMGNDAQFDFIHLTVSSGGKKEPYMFTDVGWFQTSKVLKPDPGCLPPTGHLQLLNPKHHYLTNEEIALHDVQCQEGYVKDTLSSTCMRTGHWSRSLCKVQQRKTYIMTAEAFDGTRNPISITIHGNEGSSEKLEFSNRGLRNRVEGQQSWKISSVGEVDHIHVILGDDYQDDMYTKYIHLSIHGTDEKYNFFPFGPLSGMTSLTANKLFQPSCQGLDFTKRVYGFLKYGRYKSQSTSTEATCKDLCRQDDKCKAVEFRRNADGESCLLSDTNTPKGFVFTKNSVNFQLFFRKC